MLATKYAKTLKDTQFHHTHLIDSRAQKYNWLLTHCAGITDWQLVRPQEPHWFFIPVNLNLGSEYEQNPKVVEVFPVNSVGLYTARDDFAIAWSPSEIEHRLRKFIGDSIEKARSNFKLGQDTTEWQIEWAQKDVKNSGLTKHHFREISYRPFDARFTYYSGQSRGFMCRPRPEVMQHMLDNENIAFCFIRRSREDSTNNFFIVRHIVDKSILSSADNANVAPLWLYPEQDKLSFSKDPRPNLSPKFIRQLGARLGLIEVDKFGFPKSLTPENIFQYIYGVFYSPGYRDRYSEFLKIDFPRLPLTGNLELFRALSQLGGELVALHLMESPKLDNHITKWPGKIPSCEIEKVTYSDETVWIDKANSEGFRGVPENVWNFHIGGYRVCHKWLKDRKGRQLSKDEIEHYQKIVIALNETIRLMAEIDDVINAHGGWPDAFQTSSGVGSTKYEMEPFEYLKAAEERTGFGNNPKK